MLTEARLDDPVSRLAMADCVVVKLHTRLRPGCLGLTTQLERPIRGQHRTSGANQRPAVSVTLHGLI